MKRMRNRKSVIHFIIIEGALLPVSHLVTKIERGYELNVGLALVTPCYMLYDLLHTETARKEREALEAQS
ncbi:MAG: hypothetical protein ACJ72J_15295 [Nitrososphaeraceae archaeon]